MNNLSFLRSDLRALETDPEKMAALTPADLVALMSKLVDEVNRTFDDRERDDRNYKRSLDARISSIQSRPR